MRPRKPKRSKQRVDPRPRLYPYQRRWVEDESRFKIACKARQIGFTFAAAWRVVDKRLEKPGLSVWLSASERQAVEAVEQVRSFCRELNAAAMYEEEFLEGTRTKLRRVRLGNGSRIVALPANPDTVRGFAGDVVLDEFAFHRDAEAIWRAAFATATRGFQLEIISTPNGARGRYYELARAAGLVEPSAALRQGDAPCSGGLRPPSITEKATDEAGAHRAPLQTASPWSPHWVDLPTARAQGFVVDVESLRAAIADDEAWQQEYGCAFLSDAAHFIPPELVVAAESPAATIGFPPGIAPAGPCFLGVDIGRHRDLTVLWLVELENPAAPPIARRYLTRAVVALERQPFALQRQTLDALLARRRDGSHLVLRCAVDASGLGLMLAEELAARWGARVLPVTFTALVKEDLAVRAKRLLEERRLRLPYDPAVRAALGAVKRVITPAGNVRFDADRTEHSPHADHFWALALALAAAEDVSAPAVEFASSRAPRAFSQVAAF